MQPSSASLPARHDSSIDQRTGSSLDDTLNLPRRPRPGEQPATASATPELFQHVAHELRQPLSAIEAVAYYLEMILPSFDPRPREQVRKLRFLVDQANAILTDANQVLQNTAACPELIDLHELVSNFIADTAWRDCGIDVRSAGDSPRVFIDSIQGRHLVGSLMRLLKKIAMLGARITVTIGSVAGEAWMEFATDAADDSHFWQDLFNRPDPNIGCGSTLAVASVRRILAEHRGSISVRGDDDGGARFVVTFPQTS